MKWGQSLTDRTSQRRLYRPVPGGLRRTKRALALLARLRMTLRPLRSTIGSPPSVQCVSLDLFQNPLLPEIGDAEQAGAVGGLPAWHQRCRFSASFGPSSSARAMFQEARIKKKECLARVLLLPLQTGRKPKRLQGPGGNSGMPSLWLRWIKGKRRPPCILSEASTRIEAVAKFCQYLSVNGGDPRMSSHLGSSYAERLRIEGRIREYDLSLSKVEADRFCLSVLLAEFSSVRRLIAGRRPTVRNNSRSRLRWHNGGARRSAGS